MEIECEICRNELAVTLADGAPMCSKCQEELGQPEYDCGVK